LPAVLGILAGIALAELGWERSTRPGTQLSPAQR